MTTPKTDLPSPAKWALIGFVALGLGSLLNNFQRFGSFGFALGMFIGPALAGAVVGWLAAHVKRSMSK